MYEWVNSSLIVGRHRGTPHPDDDLGHAPAEAAFVEVLHRFAPELLHVHDLGGLPSSILDLACGQRLPTVMTIHDYHPLCPTVKLYDAHDRICLRPDPGAMCAVCCADAPDDNREELSRTLWYARRCLRGAIPPLDSALRRPRGKRLSRAGALLMDRAAGIRGTGTAPAAPGPGALGRAPRAPAHAYQRRRDVNVERLSKLDALIVNSKRSAEICRQLGVAGPPVELVPVNPPHIELLQPKRSGPPGKPLRFVVLNACHSTQKGAGLIVEVLAELSRRGLDDRYRLSVHGSVAAYVHPALAAHPSVDLRGPYSTDELDELLEEGDVGLLPSIWEEVYGFVALEFLAKGIPVIGNALGAIPEHVRPGQTGWLNHSASARELADLMAAAIGDPDEVQRLGETAVKLRRELIEPFESGLVKLGAVYEQVLARKGRG
jgi:glycosyltransferase involved in cell wall biosynthesis